MSFQGIRPHDIVKFRLPSGKVATGRAQGKRIFPTHVVVSVCRFKNPTAHAIVNEANYVGHQRSTWGMCG